MSDEILKELNSLKEQNKELKSRIKYVIKASRFMKAGKEAFYNDAFRLADERLKEIVKKDLEIEVLNTICRFHHIYFINRQKNSTKIRDKIARFYESNVEALMQQRHDLSKVSVKIGVFFKMAENLAKVIDEIDDGVIQ